MQFGRLGFRVGQATPERHSWVFSEGDGDSGGDGGGAAGITASTVEPEGEDVGVTELAEVAVGNGEREIGRNGIFF